MYKLYSDLANSQLSGNQLFVWLIAYNKCSGLLILDIQFIEMVSTLINLIGQPIH